MVDLYYALYGTKRPPCLPQNNDELARLYRPQKVTTTVVPEDVKKIEIEPTLVIEKAEEVIEEIVVPIDDKVEIIEELKKEKLDEDLIPVTDIIPLEEQPPPPQPPTTLDLLSQPSTSSAAAPPAEKKPKLEYFSENSVSLPGVSAGYEQGRPVGFEPGMFDKQIKDDDMTGGEHGKDKLKKKKKDKKKHKHKKHKHKSKDHDQPSDHTLWSSFWKKINDLKR